MNSTGSYVGFEQVPGVFTGKQLLDIEFRYFVKHVLASSIPDTNVGDPQEISLHIPLGIQVPVALFGANEASEQTVNLRINCKLRTLPSCLGGNLASLFSSVGNDWSLGDHLYCLILFRKY